MMRLRIILEEAVDMVEYLRSNSKLKNCKSGIMLKRIISGAVFVGIITGFFFLRLLSPAYFEILILVFSAIGTYEILQAFSGKITVAQKITAMAHSIVCVPVSWFFGMEASLYLLLFVAMLQLAFAVMCHKAVSLEGVGLSLFATIFASTTSYVTSYGSSDTRLMLTITPECPSSIFMTAFFPAFSASVVSVKEAQ